MKPKTWCRHIKWRCGIAANTFEFPVRDWTGHKIYIPVPRSWKLCPICGTERPTRTNIKAAKLQFEMDNDL